MCITAPGALRRGRCRARPATRSPGWWRKWGWGSRRWRWARGAGGETVAVFGVGGLGISAVQLAAALGALEVYAVDRQPAKLQAAAGYGAIPVDAAAGDPVAAIRAATGGRGVDVALELIGL